MAEEDLWPSAYAPYTSPREYILNWTDVIWIDRAIGLLADHYDRQVKVHTAYGETYDFDMVINNSVQKFAAFPNTGGGLGEDVIWEQRGANGFISSHRTIKSGTHSGYWTYGPPTGRDFVSRTIAHCLVQDNRIVEEWLVRDEWAVLQGLGLDPDRIAAELASASPATGERLGVIMDTGAFSGRYGVPGDIGVSGQRPNRHMRECAMLTQMFETVWNERRFDRVAEFVSERIVLQTVRNRRVQNITPYQMEAINLLASFPDGKIELRDLVVCDEPGFGLRISAIWVLRGTYCGVPTYGTITRSPISLLGASHFEIVDGKILREWRLFDELAVLTQIMAARQAGTTAHATLGQTP
jgi:predicted ester cyclase